ncbi:forkhead box protein N1 [Trichonephila clavata]|uniref:Forkhead box protein N1 n=1 Tax=Trichonephila clavata TaxID=2740835 RepID=A0A8X6G4H2_TRICU|nr:forkhead box protein N1 [Trichonephila clavata]
MLSSENFPYFKTAPNGWKNSVRHNLSLNKCFEKIEKPVGNNSTQRKGYLWAMNPAKIEKMEEELQKWGSKDPAAIRKSMANPERLALIEKGELRSPDSDTEYESMAVSQEDEDDSTVEEKENEVKVQVANVGNDILNDEFSTLGDSMNIEPCLPDLDSQLQKDVWENLSDGRMQFLSDSPMSPLSPKNTEAMDEDSSLDFAPSVQRSYSQANFIYKNAPRASTSSTNSNRLRTNSSRKDKAELLCVVNGRENWGKSATPTDTCHQQSHLFSPDRVSGYRFWFDSGARIYCFLQLLASYRAY